MLNTNNIVNYEINIKQKEKKYSLATVLAWLYLKTIGRMLPERWNKWAENILYYDEFTIDDGAQTDAFKAVDLEPEVVARRIQSETSQHVATQTDDLITIDRSVQIDLEPKATEGESEDEGVYSKASNGLTDEDSSDIEMDNENAFADENYNTMEEICTEGNEQLENVNQELELECSRNVLLNETNINLESKLKASDEELVKAEETIAHLKKELIEASEKSKQLKLQLAEHNEENEKLRSKNEELEREKREATVHLMSLRESALEEREQLKKYKESYIEFKNISDQIEKELEEQVKENLVEITERNRKISSLTQLNKDLEQDKKAMNDKNQSLQTQVTKLKDNIASEISSLSHEKETLQSNTNILIVQLQDAQKSKQQLEKEKIDLEDKLKDSSSKLSAAEKENKRLENEVTKLQEQAWTPVSDILEGTNSDLVEILGEGSVKREEYIEQLQKEHKQAKDQLNADIAKLQEENKGLVAEIDSLRKNLSIMVKQLEQQQLLNNQEQQELGKELKSVDKKLEDMNKKNKEQAKTKVLDTASIAKSTTKSTLSKFLPNKLLKNESLNKFLSDQNKKLKESFPELQGKHFCHNVLDETIKSLSNQDDGKSKSNKLLELLESNLTKSAREIIEAEVKEIVKKYCDIGNMDKELRDGVLKDKLLPSVKRCMKKLSWDEKGAVAITDSVLQDFRNGNNISNGLLKEIVVKELVKGRVNFFSSNIQSLQLASSIRDTFISPDQKMCSKIIGEKNEYQLTEKAKEEYVPNSSMRHVNSTLVSVKQEATSR